jgi:hypothetical protein
MNTSVHEFNALSFNCFYVINIRNALFRPAMYGSGRPTCASASNMIHVTFQRVSTARAAAAAAGSEASTIDLAAMTKLAPASIASRALPP